MSGKIHTFYSYKGGVGRTLCLANVATLLARWGWNVLCIDMDLEAPKLDRYLASHSGHREINGGVVDWLTDIWEGRNADSWRDWVIPIEDAPLSGSLALLPAGNPADHNYLSKVQALDWTALYQKRNMGQLLENFKTTIRNEYDLILIDSRTGVSDSGGICTIQLPDAITFFFTPNEQSLHGAASTMRHVQAARMKTVTEPGPALMLPVLTRFEQEKEYKKAAEWRIRILKEIGAFYLPWIPSPRLLSCSGESRGKKEISPEIRDIISSFLDQTTVPQVAFWSFGEPLPVLEEANPRKDMISFTYENIAALIANGFSAAGDLLRERSSYLARSKKRKRSEGNHIFLSYSKENSHFAKDLADALSQKGLNVWSDFASLESGTTRYEAVDIGIQQSDSLVVIDSGNGSRQVNSDIATFIRSREEDGNDLDIIPIRLSDQLSTSLLQGFPVIDGQELLKDEGAAMRMAEQISEAMQRKYML